jgi:hypothetical protein
VHVGFRPWIPLLLAEELKMALFQIRIELFSADWSDYVQLAKCLAAKGIVDTIVGSNGTRYKLPPAEYHYDGNATAQQVVDAAKACAATVVNKYAVVVGQCTEMLWFGLDTA